MCSGNSTFIISLIKPNFHLIINPARQDSGKKLFLWCNPRKANVIEAGKAVFSVQLILKTLRKLDGVQAA